MSDMFTKPEVTESQGNKEDICYATTTDCVVDIETMGTKVGAPILSIGAVLFDPYHQDSVQRLEMLRFVRNIDIEDAIKHSDGVAGGTLKWWLGQEDAAIKALVSEETVTLKQALMDFRIFMTHRDKKFDKRFYPGHHATPVASRLWAKSPDFDCKILEAAADRVGEELPLKYWQWRCVRTAQDFAWPEGPETRPTFEFGVAHDAGADAVNEALTIQAAYLKLGLNHKNLDVTVESF